MHSITQARTNRFRLVGLACAAIAIAVCANAQSAAPRKLRLVVIGQTDSTSLLIADSIRASLERGPEGARLILTTASGVAYFVREAYKRPDYPLFFPDINELARLLRADIVVGLTPDTLQKPYGVIAMLAIPPRGQTRVLGTSIPLNLGTVPRDVLAALRADSAFRGAMAAP